ncbi:MAG TPA: beta-galactosidase [Candidatus Acidoferrales bacterium]|nr:beta-galactosidase [Candidatus Acidoferrales bacterium]
MAGAPPLVYKCLPMNAGVNRAPSLLRLLAVCLLLLIAPFGLIAWAGRGQSAKSPQSSPSATTSRGLEIAIHGGYPELRVDGTPFFIHSAAFHYYRIPRDQWSFLLDRYRDLGINTIDIYIPWNWHEPAEGNIDFDGHSNPRRDLRALLKTIATKGFKLIARPGPQILNEWKNGGYPDWLLRRPEYKMDATDVLEGRYPPLSGLNTRNADAAAQAWLDNPVHMNYARQWLEAVARELAPYSASEMMSIPPAKNPVSGPLLFVQLEDDMAINRDNYAGPAFWHYMQSLREMLRDGGLRVPAYINPTDMRVSAAGEGLADPIGAMGQWYMPPRKADGAGQRLLDDDDASEIEFYTEELKTQPQFPPVMIEYQPGWYCPGDDDRPVDSPPENMLLSSRLLIANGAHGFNYFPLQDTVTPAGDSVPWANRFYRWDAPLDVNGSDQPRAAAVRRDGEFLGRWGSWLAAAHKRADFGIAYPLGSFPQEKLTPADIKQVSETILRLEMLGQLTHLSSELLDPEYQPVEQFLRDPVILLPAFDPGKPEFQMSDKSERVLAEYVQRGGTLVVFPRMPAGSVFEDIAKASSTPGPSGGVISAELHFGGGRVFQISQDFSSSIDLDESYARNASAPEIPGAGSALNQVLNEAGVRPAVMLEFSNQPASDLVITELVSNEGTGLLGERRGGQGMLSVTNLGSRDASQNVEILSPAASSRFFTHNTSEQDSSQSANLSLHLEIPPRESLLLPIEQPLCSVPPLVQPCHDSVVDAGAELLSAERSGKTLDLTFYAPSRAEAVLHLDEKPTFVSLLENMPAVHWSANQHELTVTVPRGAAPDYRRVVSFKLHYEPHVTEKPETDTAPRHPASLHVLNAVSLPLGDTASMETYPPLVIVNPGEEASLALEATNPFRSHLLNNAELMTKEQIPGQKLVYEPLTRERSEKLSIHLDGPLHGDQSFGVHKGLPTLEKMKLDWPAKSGQFDPFKLAGPDGLLREKLQIHSDLGDREIPITFLITANAKQQHYEYDFDRDGASEWVLENEALRLIVSPESGGRALAFVDKSGDEDLISSVGALRDGFSYWENVPGASATRERGRYGLFNRAYTAKWSEASHGTALEMHYEAPDVLPAGATIGKSIHLDGPDAIRADYQVSLTSSPSAGTFNHPQSFVVETSVVVSSGSSKDQQTQFCWQPLSSDSPGSPASGPATPTKSELHCEPFVPGGKPIAVPAGVDRVQVRTPGRNGLAMEWNFGDMTIEPKLYFALLKLQFPPLTPGGPAGSYSIHLRVPPAN